MSNIPDSRCDGCTWSTFKDLSCPCKDCAMRFIDEYDCCLCSDIGCEEYNHLHVEKVEQRLKEERNDGKD